MFLGFVEAAEQGVVEENVPDAVVDLLESDEMTVECLREELLSRMKSEGAGVADAPDFEVAWIFGWSDLFGVRTCRRFPSRSGSFIVEGLVRSNLVVDTDGRRGVSIESDAPKTGSSRTVGRDWMTLFVVHPGSSALRA